MSAPTLMTSMTLKRRLRVREYLSLSSSKSDGILKGLHLMRKRRKCSSQRRSRPPKRRSKMTPVRRKRRRSPKRAMMRSRTVTTPSWRNSMALARTIKQLPNNRTPLMRRRRRLPKRNLSRANSQQQRVNLPQPRRLKSRSPASQRMKQRPAPPRNRRSQLK